MLRTMLKSTVHGVTVTHADPHHADSITVDPDLMDAADLLAGERVAVVDLGSGTRLETHAVAGERGTGVLGVNGTAARLIGVGEEVVVTSYVAMDDAQARAHRPTVVRVDAANRPVPDQPAGPPPAPAAQQPAETDDAARLDALIQAQV